ncbi:MAG: polyprenyl diphosphate synthase [Candidatus Saccharimonadales bacterium]
MSGIVPNHIGFILDGNRRWAQEHNLLTLEGHRRGAEVFEEIALYSFKRGIKNVTGFVFSTENWQRTDEEVGYLMNLVVKAVENYLETFHEEGIRIVILGRRDGLRAKVLRAIKKAEEKTAKNTTGTLGLCFNYGGQNEIVDAVKSIVSDSMKPEDIDVTTVSNNLYAPELPDVDLVVRTSGEKRLSGFMMWRCAYAELSFCDKYWPDYSKGDLDEALKVYGASNRRFGF